MCDPSTLITDDSTKVSVGDTFADEIGANPDSEHGHSVNDRDHRIKSPQQDAENNYTDELGTKSEINPDEIGVKRDAKHGDSENGRNCRNESSQQDAENNHTDELGAESEVDHVFSKNFPGHRAESPFGLKETLDRNICLNGEKTKDISESEVVRVIESRNINAGEGQDNGLQGPFLQMPCKEVVGNNFDVDSIFETSGMYDETQLNLEQNSAGSM